MKKIIKGAAPAVTYLEMHTILWQALYDVVTGTGLIIATTDRNLSNPDDNLEDVKRNICEILFPDHSIMNACAFCAKFKTRHHEYNCPKCPYYRVNSKPCYSLLQELNLLYKCISDKTARTLLLTEIEKIKVWPESHCTEDELKVLNQNLIALKTN